MTGQRLADVCVDWRPKSPGSPCPGKAALDEYLTTEYSLQSTQWGFRLQCASSDGSPAWGHASLRSRRGAAARWGRKDRRVLSIMRPVVGQLITRPRRPNLPRGNFFRWRRNQSVFGLQDSCVGQWKSVPSAHMRWRMTPILRAKATTAFLRPRRLARRIAQDLKADGFATRVIRT